MTQPKCGTCRFFADWNGEYVNQWADAQFGLCHLYPPVVTTDNATRWPEVDRVLDFCGEHQPHPTAEKAETENR